MLPNAMTIRCSAAIGLAVLLIAAGCGQPDGGTQSGNVEQQAQLGGQELSQQSQSQTVTQAERAIPKEQVHLEVADENRLRELIESKRGKVVLVDYWATWCPTCVELFPHTVEMYHKYKEQGFDVVSVSVDDTDDKEAVIDFLSRVGAEFDNVLAKYGASQRTVEAFEITDGALPHYKLYDRAGTLRRTFLAQEVTPELLEENIKALLTEPAPE